MEDLTKELEQFSIPPIEKGVATLNRIKDERMPIVKDDIVIIKASEYEELKESKAEPEQNSISSSQLERLLNTMNRISIETKYCSPEILFEGEEVTVRDKYIHTAAYTSKSIVVALRDYLQHVIDTRESTKRLGIKSTYSFYYPEGKKRADKRELKRKSFN